MVIFKTLKGKARQISGKGNFWVGAKAVFRKNNNGCVAEVKFPRKRGTEDKVKEVMGDAVSMGPGKPP